MLGEKQSVREVLYGVYCGGARPGMRCVKKGDWKLIRYQSDKGKVRETQLFNLARNPHELISQHHEEAVISLSGHKPGQHQRNLADDPGSAGKLAEMEKLLLDEMRRLDDPYRLWNQPDDGLPVPEYREKVKRPKKKRSPRPGS